MRKFVRSSRLKLGHNRIICRPRPISVWVEKKPKESVPEKKNNHHQLLEGITLPNWQAMIEGLLSAGYTIKQIANSTHISQRSIQRWRKKNNQASPQLFSAILRFYCHYKVIAANNQQSKEYLCKSNQTKLVI